MNWRLIFLLSLLGLAMSLASVSLIPEKYDMMSIGVLLLINAFVLARYLNGRYFVSGIMVSLFNAVYITAVHVIFYDTYIANHPAMVKMGDEGMMHSHSQMSMVMMGPIIGIGIGLVQGFLAWLASKIMKKPSIA
jgi:hypothetical protein